MKCEICSEPKSVSWIDGVRLCTPCYNAVWRCNHCKRELPRDNEILEEIKVIKEFRGKYGE